MESGQDLLNVDLQIDTEAHRHLAVTAKWAKFLSIIGFVFCGLILFSSIFSLIGIINPGSSKYYYRSESSRFIGQEFTFFFLLVFAVICFFTSFFTLRFATKMKTALQNTNQLAFNDALGNLSKNYKFLGILTIIYLVFMLLMFIGFMYIASFSRF